MFKKRTKVLGLSVLGMGALALSLSVMLFLGGSLAALADVSVGDDSSGVVADGENESSGSSSEDEDSSSEGSSSDDSSSEDSSSENSSEAEDYTSSTSSSTDEATPESDSEGEANTSDRNQPVTDGGSPVDPETTDKIVPEGERVSLSGLGMPPESAMVSAQPLNNPVYATVTTIVSDKALANGLFPGEPAESVVFEARVEAGEFAGTTVSSVQRLDPVTGKFFTPVRPGDRVYLTLFRDSTQSIRGLMSSFRRVEVLYIVAAVCAIMLMFLCRRLAGVKISAAIIGSVLILSFVMLPMLRAGAHPLLAGGISCFLMLVFSIWVIYGIKYRTIAATIGSTLSLLVSGLLVGLTSEWLKLSGVMSVDRLRSFYSEATPKSLPALLIAGVLVSAVGAVVVISNVVAAGGDPKLVGEKFGRITSQTVFRTALSRGCSALAPVVLTLSFSTLGFLLFTFVIISTGGMPLGRIMSDELVVAELLRMFAGILGLLSCIPITAMVSSIVLQFRTTAKGELKEFYVAERLIGIQQELFSSIARSVEGTSDNAAKLGKKKKAKKSAGVTFSTTDEEALETNRDTAAVTGATEEEHAQKEPVAAAPPDAPEI